MSTHIQIGQPYIFVEDSNPRGIRVNIQEVTGPHDATPAFIEGFNGVYGEPTNHILIATLSYIEGVKRVGLGELFEDEQSGFNRYASCGPIVTLLNEGHLQQVEAALARCEIERPRLLGDIGLLTWISYWMRWALANCETPAILIWG